VRRGWFAVLLVPFVFVGVPRDATMPDREVAHSLVRISARGCTAVDTVATGWRTSGGLVVTVAHAVRGSNAVRADGMPARIVEVDNRTDVAVLVPATTALDGSALAIATAPDGTPRVRMARFDRAGETRTVSSAAAGPVVTATIDEPVDDVSYSRHAFSLSVAADHGDSGAPVVDGRGRVTGMVFATARDGSPVTYAVAADDIGDGLQRVDVNSPAVDPGRCN
jgi:S1-C subfamily serine protease